MLKLRRRASLVAETEKNPPVMQETQGMRLRSLGWEDPLEKGTATHSSIPAWRIHGQRSLAGYNPRGLRVGHDWATNTSTTTTQTVNTPFHAHYPEGQISKPQLIWLAPSPLSSCLRFQQWTLEIMATGRLSGTKWMYILTPSFS